MPKVPSSAREQRTFPGRQLTWHLAQSEAQARSLAKKHPEAKVSKLVFFLRFFGRKEKNR